MADTEPALDQTIDATFLTWHDANGDVHMRTENGPLLYIPKSDQDLVGKAKQLPRGTRIRAVGGNVYSKTLSSYVFQIVSLDAR